jgi:hypothetical protein
MENKILLVHIPNNCAIYRAILGVVHLISHVTCSLVAGTVRRLQTRFEGFIFSSNCILSFPTSLPPSELALPVCRYSADVCNQIRGPSAHCMFVSGRSINHQHLDQWAPSLRPDREHFDRHAQAREAGLFTGVDTARAGHVGDRAPLQQNRPP